MPLTSPLLLPEAAERAALAASFARERCARLPGLLGPELLSRAQERLDRAAFKPWNLGDWDARETPDDDFLNVALPVLLNDPRLFRAVEAVAGVSGIRRLTGRVYRSRPVEASGHFCGWHKDSENGERLASMTILLGRAPFAGGQLELRRAGEAEAFARPAYGSPGDALLFAVGPDVEHRAAPLLGGGPKDILAVWFHRA